MPVDQRGADGDRAVGGPDFADDRAFGDGGASNAWIGGLDKAFFAGIAVSTVEKQHARALRLLRASLARPDAADAANESTP